MPWLKVGVMKVCGFVGNPRRNGNVDLLVSQVPKGASSRGAETHKIYLNDLHIKPCQSCGVDPAPRHYLFNDDMEARAVWPEDVVCVRLQILLVLLVSWVLS